MRKHLLPHIAAVWVSTEVFGSVLSWDEAKAALSEINWESASLSMSMLNAVCAELALGGRLDNHSGAQKVAALTQYLFTPEARTGALRVYLENRGQGFVPLAGQACIAMTEACLRFCSREGGARFEQPHQHPNFARILLSFHEQLMRGDLAKNLKPDDLSKDQFRYFVRNYLSANFEFSFSDLLRRHYMLFCDPSPNGVMEQRAGKSASAWFTEIIGLEPRRYGALMLFGLYHGQNFDIAAPDLRHLVYNIDEMLANATADAATVYRRLHDLSVVPGQLPDANVPDWETAIYGLHHLRAKPLLQLHGSQFICLHKHLLVEKLFGGTVHVLTELVDSHAPEGWHADAKKRRFKVRIEFGYLFEDYLRKVLLAVLEGPDTKYRFGFQRADGGECDALFIIGNTALALEFVHHPWSLSERSDGDASVFIKHLEDNITKAGKLCAQIAKDGGVSELDASVDRAIPIVITSDVFPINVMTALTLEKRLIEATNQQFVQGHGIVLPTQILSATQLENLDRIVGVESAVAIAEFLSFRASDVFLRLTGHYHMDQKLGASRKLKKYDDASEAAFRDVSRSLFKSAELE